LSRNPTGFSLGTDNDFSVTQNPTTTAQSNVCTNLQTSVQVPLASSCPDGLSLIPSFLYAFTGELDNFVAPAQIPAPGALLLLSLGLATAGLPPCAAPPEATLAAPGSAQRHRSR
jgi:hypothetical protein